MRLSATDNSPLIVLGDEQHRLIELGSSNNDRLRLFDCIYRIGKFHLIDTNLLTNHK